MQLNAHHRRTAQAILAHPVSHNVEWRDVVSLLRSIGNVTEEHNGKFKIDIGGEVERIERPRGKDINEQTVVDLRRILSAAGLSSEGLSKRGDMLLEPAAEGPAGHAILVLAYHGAAIYSADAQGSAPTKIVPSDPDGTLRTMHHKANNHRGWYGKVANAWYAELAAALRPIGEILIVGNGTGHSNVMLQFTQYLAEHDRDLLDRIAGSIEADVEDLTSAQVLALARTFYSEDLPRDYGDGRWGEKTTRSA